MALLAAETKTRKIMNSNPRTQGLVITSTNRNNLISWVTVHLGFSELGDVPLPPNLSDEQLKKAETHIQQLCANTLRIGRLRGAAEVRDGVKAALAL